MTEVQSITCDHIWETVDDSFDHEYGTEVVVYERCSICDQQREIEDYIE